MPLSTDVKLPRDYQPQFAEECIRCSGETFRNSMKFSTRNIGWHNLLWFLPGSKASVVVPACEGCAFRMRVQKWGSAFMTLFLIAACIVFVFPHMEAIARPWRRWAMIGVGLLCISPVIVWEIFWPPTFDITSTKKSISYEFKNRNQAFDFAERNDDAEWMEVS